MIETLPTPVSADTEWFVQSRFGLFIHWGLYAAPGPPRVGAEPRADHRRGLPALLRPRSTPTSTTRRRGRARPYAAGMRYAVITTKHHDGFCLWDSALTDYKAPNTPAGRDLLRPFVEAFRAAGLRRRLLPLADRLAPPASSRSTASIPMRDDAAFKARAKRPRHRACTASTCTARSASCSPATARSTSCGSTSPTRTRLVGRARARTTGASEQLLAMVARAAAGHHRQRPAGDRRATSSRRSSTSPRGRREARRRAGAVGGVPDAERQLGLRPRQPRLEVARDCSCRCWSTRSSKGGNLLLNVGPTARGEFDPRALRAPARHRRVDAPARAGDPRLRGRARHARRPTAATPSAATGSTCTSSPGRSATSISRASPAGSAAARLLNDGSEIAMTVVEPGQAGQNTTMAGMPPGTLTLELPIQRPPGVVVPVIELRSLGLTSSPIDRAFQRPVLAHRTA